MRPIVSLLAAFTFVAGACAPAAAPAPTAAPAAKPPAATAPAAQPAGGKPTAGQSLEPPAEILEAAKKEGKVVWYTGAGEDEVNEFIAKRLRDKYGITLEYIGASGADTEQRVLAESRAGRVVGDVFMAGASNRESLGQQGILDDSFQFEKDIPNAQFVSKTLPGGGVEAKAGAAPGQAYAAAVQANMYGLNLNTNLVSKEQYPKVWDDILKPEFKDKIALITPYASGPGSSWFHLMLKEKGQAWMERFAQQNPVIVARRPEAEAMAARGEKAIVVPGGAQIFQSQSGAPVASVLPEDGIYVSVTGAGMIKGAPHPNAAKVLLNELLSVDVQKAYADLAFTTPVRSDVVPERDFLRWPTGKLLPNVDLKQLPADRKLAETIFKK